MLNKVLSLSYFSILGLALVELLRYRGIITAYVGTDYWVIFTIFLVVAAIYRLVTKKQFHPRVVRINKTVVYGSLLLFLVTYTLEAVTFANYIYSTFKINHFIFLDVLIFSYLFYVINMGRSYMKQHFQRIVLILFLLICYHIYTYNYPLFAQISLNASGHDDDNFMEWLQVVVLVCGAVISFVSAIVIRAPLLARSVLLVAACVFIFLGGEEISWGERLLSLNIKSTNNYQNEINIHNKAGFNELSAILYYGIFLYALMSWGLRHYLDKKNKITAKHNIWWDIFTFKGVEVLYLLPTFIFNPYMDRGLSSSLPSILDIYNNAGLIPDFFQTLRFLANWRESFEVLFYAGLTLHVWNVYQNNSKTKKALK